MFKLTRVAARLAATSTALAISAVPALALTAPSNAWAAPTPATAAPFYGSLGGVHLAAPVVDMVSTPDGHGYYLLGSDGGVFAFGDAHFYGSLPGIEGHDSWYPRLSASSMAVTPDGGGYWIVTPDGRLFAFGDAHHYGDLECSLGCSGDPITHLADPVGAHLAGPITDIASTPDGHGYWMLGSDGGVFTFGDAHFYGSIPGLRVTNLDMPGPWVGLVPTASGHGYQLFEGTHSVGAWSFGDAPAGWAGADCPSGFNSAPQVDMWTSPDGYTMVRYGCDDIITFDRPLNSSVIGSVADPAGGHWLYAADGGVFTAP